MTTAARAFLDRAARHPGRAAYRALAAGGAPRDAAMTWGAWAADARRFAAALVADGVKPGESVAILAGTGTLWPVADLGVLLAGGVSVGIYPTSAPAQVRQILADCAARALVVDDAEQLAKALAARDDLPHLRTLVAVDAFAEGVIGWDAWLERGGEALAAGAGAEIDRRVASASPGDTAVLIYTSGSTGEPKGAELSHRNLLASAASIVEALGLTERDTTLSFLPFCHAAERVFGLYTRIACGMEAALVPDHTRVWEAARVYAPTLFGGLPRFYEKAYEALHAEHTASAGEGRARWDRVVQLGVTRSRLVQARAFVPPTLEQEWRELGAPLFERARTLFGGRIRRATSGGAALPREVAEYLDALGITVLGAYGLTEHLCVAMNRPDAYRFDAAGQAMPGTEIRVAEDGEILVRRGELSFSRYHGRPRASEEAFTQDGWLLTGDLGELLDDGALRVTGRKKELIALSTGKKVAPLPIEAALAQDPWIGQAMLYGEGQKFISALISLRPSMLRRWAGANDQADGSHGNGDGDGVLRDPELLTRVQAAVDRVNAGLSRTERIRRFVVIGRELTAEDGDLTPTLKLRRTVVAEKFRGELDALYQSAG
ncbi:AMP-dependent synthetase/ligase [Longimicrobium sp.]|uniref:AMP-dependent synthetase/ligase n=1 Tax=Longimicrobium sp. TaxID=2029185 RepID=UPI002C4ACA7C|nr:AMP-binding protein [Longimicrobium sp.]HSU12746.1 AMP-binding protein [Longimicrobium sp.]